MARDTWHRLDNVGKFYASQAGSPFQTVFRYSATMSEPVDPDALQSALERTIRDFPGFNVCLRSGMFWHYLEQSDDVPRAEEERLAICQSLHVHAKSVLFRTTYYRSRINLEVSHIVSDGRGSLDFFRALLYSYVEARYGAACERIAEHSTAQQKSENSFDKYFEKDKAGPSKTPRPYRLPKRVDALNPTYLEYHLPADRVVALSKSCGVSVTSCLIAAIVCAVRKEMPVQDRGRAIKLDVPVDLRGMFESSTMKNFFGLAFVSYVPGPADEPFEEVARSVQAQLKEGTRLESMKPRMNRMIALEKNIALRYAPLFVKDFVLDLADRVNSRSVTTTLSSIGKIDLDENARPYVENVNAMTSTSGLNFIACTCGNDLSVSISTVYTDMGVVQNFCRFFSEQGIEGRIDSNKGGLL